MGTHDTETPLTRNASRDKDVIQAKRQTSMKKTTKNDKAECCAWFQPSEQSLAELRHAIAYRELSE